MRNVNFCTSLLPQPLRTSYCRKVIHKQREEEKVGDLSETVLKQREQAERERLGQPLLLWGTQLGFSLGVTELPRASPSLSSSSSPSERRSEICCCSSGLMSFSARTRTRRLVG